MKILSCAVNLYAIARTNTDTKTHTHTHTHTHTQKMQARVRACTHVNTHPVQNIIFRRHFHWQSPQVGPTTIRDLFVCFFAWQSLLNTTLLFLLFQAVFAEPRLRKGMLPSDDTTISFFFACIFICLLAGHLHKLIKLFWAYLSKFQVSEAERQELGGRESKQGESRTLAAMKANTVSPQSPFSHRVGCNNNVKPRRT